MYSALCPSAAVPAIWALEANAGTARLMTGIGWSVDVVAWVGQLEVMAPDELPDDELPEDDIDPEELPDVGDPEEEPDEETPPDAEGEPLEEASGGTAASSLPPEESEPWEPHALKSSGSQSERRRTAPAIPIVSRRYQGLFVPSLRVT